MNDILQASDGSIWCVSIGGVSRFDGQAWHAYTEADGLAIREEVYQYPVMREMRDGSFWIDNREGKMIHFRYRSGRNPPETVLEPAVERVSAAGNILLKWEGRDLWDETPPQDVRYQWRIGGGAWSAPSAGRQQTFTSLSDGRYAFEVRAVDRDGNVDATPALHAFVVEGPWWKNPWVLGGAVVLLGLVGVQTGRVVRRERRLEEANRELQRKTKSVEEANQALSAANKELFQANQALQRDRAVERIRGEVQAMNQASDFEGVLSVLAEDLKTVGLPFDTCGIDVLDEPVDKPTLAYFEEHGFQYTAYTIDPEGVVSHESYRIPAPFPPVSREPIERFIAGEPWKALIGGTRAILEVPASNLGRLRITSSDRQDFAEEDISALQEFAAAIALGYARYLDIREIHEQTERKSRFLASMSHELRTPMNAIVGFTRMVLRRSGDILPDRQKDNLSKVLQSADHLLDLINDILDLSKIEAGRMDVNVERFGVKELIAGCCAEIEPLVKPGVALKYDVSDDVGEATTDKGRVRQIVGNLLSNAVKFTERGEVVIHAIQEGGSAVISVSDTGPGIPADATDSIFEEFRQVKGSDPQHRGTGLGLSICKGFAELLGGSIRVESEVGKGSTFTVRIPMAYSEA